MEELIAEIERKRKSVEQNEITAKKKYYRRGDVLSQERQRIQNEKISTEASVNSIHDSKTDKSSFQTRNSETNSGVKGLSDSKDESFKILPRDEAIRRLRSRNLPIRLFGETEADACHRLWLSEVMDMGENKHLTNDFQNTLDKINKAILLEHYNIDGNKTSKDFLVMDSDVTIESIKDSAKNLGKSDDTTNDCDIILSFLKLILSIWARDLNKRPKDVKMSLDGRMESARYEQTYSYIKPMLKRLKDHTLPGDIQKFLSLIVHFCLEREYIKANDAYLQMAIGNAPWPIGVTCVGIHPRTGRERISAHHVAHVLNDETQRKYIQGVKRIMTYCQKTYPSDPSKSIEYGTLEYSIP